jgi:hypothetical protein
MKKLEREALLADRAAAAEILTSIPEDDVFGRASFESRLGQLDEELKDLVSRHVNIRTCKMSIPELFEVTRYAPDRAEFEQAGSLDRG